MVAVDLPARRPAQTLPLAVGVTLFTLGALHLLEQGWRRVALWSIGLLLGLCLYHAAFGFTSAYRRMFVYRDMRGVQAQLLMLALAVVLFAPVLDAGSVLGGPVAAAAAPVSLSVAIGAFVFGIGMQLAGGCGSGTLYTAGGGNLRMVLVLVSACAGSFWASLHMGWWQALPSWDAIVLGEAYGWPVSVILQLGFIASLWWGARRWGRPPADTDVDRTARGDPATWLAGPWPATAAAVLLALLNLATLVIAGHPWTITWAFTLWGAKVASAIGWDAGSSEFWRGDFQNSALAGGVLDDTTSLMDIGIMLGALCAAALAGRYAPSFAVPPRSLAAALIGGVLIGYSARVSYGCNIGAFFSGVASSSLHGWLWIAAALCGTWIGIRWRPYFGLAN